MVEFLIAYCFIHLNVFVLIPGSCLVHRFKEVLGEPIDDLKAFLEDALGDELDNRTVSDWAMAGIVLLHYFPNIISWK